MKKSVVTRKRKVKRGEKREEKLYCSSAIKRFRRTFEDIKNLDAWLAFIVDEQKPMTVRQVFYQATVRQLVPKDEGQGYRPVQRRLVALRENGTIPYGDITDNIRYVHGETRYGDVGEFLQDAQGLYRRDYWRRSKVRVEVWIEKDALASVISPIVIEKWGLSLHVARGFSSISYLHQAAEEIANDGRETFVFVLTDLDPSGVGIAHDIEAKLTAMIQGRAKLHVERLAVEPQQVIDWKLPTRPTKRSDTRAAKFIAKYGAESVELDAIEPNMLRKLIDDAITRVGDSAEVQFLKHLEKIEREQFSQLPKAFTGLAGGE